MKVGVVNVDPDFGYIVLVILATVILLQWLGIKVSLARKKYDVKYPEMYSADKPIFNCVQRAHQNTLEVLPVFLMLLIFGGLQYPRLCAVAGLTWVVSRVFYAQGYYTGDPQKRMRGSFGYIGLIMLLGSTVMFAISLLGWI